MNLLETVWVIIPAAGSGQRFGNEQPKQYLQAANQTILEHTLSKFSLAKKIILALSEADKIFGTLPCAKNPNIEAVIGGSTRAQSVINALQGLKNRAQSDDWIIVHDAVRPCLASEDLQHFLVSLKDDPVGGLLASPVQDTLKELRDGKIKTCARENLWHALTPQMFRYEILLKALTQGSSVTDEAQAIEALGLTPKIVPAQYPNPKLTYTQDLPYITWLLQCA